MVTELFIREQKLNISTVFIAQSYFWVPKNVGLNSTYYFIMKIPKKLELEKIAFSHSSAFDLKYLKVNFYKKCTAKSYSHILV